MVAMATASIRLSIYPSWQCFKGICSFLMNVIKAREMCDADSGGSFSHIFSRPGVLRNFTLFFFLH